ncbi:MAG: DUF896 domain-containing protein [Eubacterium sp.]|nr:DUF896 domain-containing protein [Eubacterium sp.]
MNEQKIKRINELYHKSKSVGLTEAEKAEQQVLRKEYIAAIRANIDAQMANVRKSEKRT